MRSGFAAPGPTSNLNLPTGVSNGPLHEAPLLLQELVGTDDVPQTVLLAKLLGHVGAESDPDPAV